MTYGRHLEQRKFGVYYFRKTKKIGDTEKVKRFSLKTKDLGVAKFLALQFLANIKMHEINIESPRGDSISIGVARPRPSHQTHKKIGLQQPLFYKK